MPSLRPQFAQVFEHLVEVVPPFDDTALVLARGGHGKDRFRVAVMESVQQLAGGDAYRCRCQPDCLSLC